MDLFDIITTYVIIGGIIGGAVYGTHKLMTFISVPEPFTWVIPLIIFFVAVALLVKHLWN